MELYGIYLASHHSCAIEVYSLAEIDKVLDQGKIPVLLPYRTLRVYDALPHSWSVTSDSIAVYLGRLLGSELVILSKPIDGIIDKRRGLIRTISCRDLSREKMLVMDKFALELACKYKIKLAILNAFKPWVLEDAVRMKTGDYTLILPE